MLQDMEFSDTSPTSTADYSLANLLPSILSGSLEFYRLLRRSITGAEIAITLGGDLEEDS